jgi:hypothetical protein
VSPHHRCWPVPARGSLLGYRIAQMPRSPSGLILTPAATRCADGVTGITGALAALSEYFTTKQTKQDDCGLDLGWGHPNATVTAKSIDNTAECSGAHATSCLQPLRLRGYWR